MPQAILLQDVEQLGERGSVIDVSPGYLRNYLVPRKLAQPATRAALEAAPLAQVLGQRDQVDRLALLVQVEHRRVDDPVLLAVEVLGPKAVLDRDRIQRPVADQDRAEDRLLRLQVVGRGKGGDALSGGHGSGAGASGRSRASSARI